MFCLVSLILGGRRCCCFILFFVNFGLQQRLKFRANEISIINKPMRFSVNSNSEVHKKLVNLRSANIFEKTLLFTGL